ncbi:tripartite tricarboxylate transporter substrate binding protein [Reyranella sp.]|uniref:Bug family tripartite tricarboxylate transporter substrate binding protein n=1 Tax=Reyranella sp. TaxID=1929291 RepID=UPI0025F0A648|nr:tripartite tricarboxylate transporter substrate binding protein [Reyranella sp.]
MNNITRRAIGKGLMSLPCLSVFPSTGWAQMFPAGPVRVVVPTAPGGALDIMSRLVTARLADDWKQSVIVDNKAGGSGILGSNIVANAPPDGLTVLFTTSTHAVNPVLLKSIPYDTETAFTPIATIAETAYALVGSAKSNFSDAAALFADIRAQPGKYAIGSSENSARLVGDLIKNKGKLSFESVLYKGAAPMLQEVVSGVIPAGITTPVSAMSHHRSGTAKILAITSEKRLPVLADVPTIGELGIPGVVCSVWFAVFGPKGLPPTVADKFHDGIAKALRDSAIIAKIRDFGAEPSGEGPAALAARLKTDLAQWRQLAQAAGVQPE